MRVRRELEQRKRRLAIMTYDDLLTRLRDILAGPNGGGGQATAAQSATTSSWSTSSRTPIRSNGRSCPARSRTEGVTLVLVADPKQAIYAFRGAEVYAYLEAAKIAGARDTLLVNRRSDQPLLDAFDALFADARLGHPEIVYRQLGPRRPTRPRGCAARRSDAALRVRVVHRDQSRRSS